jgi:ribulose-phosphate 3-epimerase
MIAHPEEALPLYVETGAQRIVVHLESVTDLSYITEHHTAHTYELGFSISNYTPLAVLTNVLHHADYVQLMGIRSIGTQGQPFDEEVLHRITALKRLKPDILISIDGSVNTTTLPRLKDAGAERFVSGSAILGVDDPKRAYEALTLL